VKGLSRAVARRYAHALVDVARPSRAAEELRRELQAAAALLDEHRELAGVLGHPAIPLDAKKRVAAGVWPKGKASELFRRLVELLVERDRIALLPAIEEAFTELWNAERGVMAAEALSARELEPPERTALARALGAATGLEVELRARVDPSLLGGLLVRMGGRTYDGTVRAQLRALRRALVSGVRREQGV
jgi:F-type H+-transporting ATPase subunit delta